MSWADRHLCNIQKRFEEGTEQGAVAGVAGREARGATGRRGGEAARRQDDGLVWMPVAAALPSSLQLKETPTHPEHSAASSCGQAP